MIRETQYSGSSFSTLQMGRKKGGNLRFPLNQVNLTLLAGQTTKQEAVILGLEHQ